MKFFHCPTGGVGGALLVWLPPPFIAQMRKLQDTEPPILGMKGEQMEKRFKRRTYFEEMNLRSSWYI